MSRYYRETEKDESSMSDDETENSLLISPKGVL